LVKTYSTDQNNLATSKKHLIDTPKDTL